jgi:hypothetical protein
MSTDANPSLSDRFRQWPRAIQWAVLALVAIGMFFLWDTYLKKFQENIGRAADSIETQAGEIRKASEVVRSLQNNREVVEGLGAVAKPKDAAKGTRELQDTINEILKKHPISGQELDLRTKGRLPPGTLTSVTSRRLDRLNVDLKFIATPEDAAAIIADLESSPVIASVNTVRLVKDANRKIKVNLSIESWVESSEAGRGARG